MDLGWWMIHIFLLLPALDSGGGLESSVVSGNGVVEESQTRDVPLEANGAIEESHPLDTLPETNKKHILVKKKDNAFGVNDRNRLHGLDTSIIRPPLEEDYTRCRKKTTCILIPPLMKTCFGTRLPYNYTSSDLIQGLSFHDIQHQLKQWEAVESIPKCWASLQPFLCSVYLPRCDPEGDVPSSSLYKVPGMVHLPSLEMCRATRSPCRAVEQLHGWLDFLTCEHMGQPRFPSLCKNPVRELSFNRTGHCPPLMVRTEKEDLWTPLVDGCGRQCQNPLFTNEEHESIHYFISVAAGLSLAANIFTVLTFLIDWRSGNRYPALLILYLNICWAAISTGWLVQFSSETARDRIVCLPDGSPRLGAPSTEENTLCFLVFVLVYYFLIAGLVWFVILSYAWFVSFRALGKVKEEMHGKGAYFHLTAWSIPLVLTITVLAMGQVDGDSLTGICFLTLVIPSYGIIFLLVPLMAALLIGGFFLSRCLWLLVRLKATGRELMPEKAATKIKETIIRMMIFLIGAVGFVAFAFYHRLKDWELQSSWKDTFINHIICRVNETAHELVNSWGSPSQTCAMGPRPSLFLMKLDIVSLFCMGILLGSWVWTRASLGAWRRFWQRLSGQEPQEPPRLKKHRMIAQAFAKRHDLHYAGRLSISFHQSFQDPVGLDFDLDNVNSGEDISSAWAAAIPQFLQRRGALAGAAVFSRRGSLESEQSRRWSFESRLSRRQSLDSQVSGSEMEVGRRREKRRFFFRKRSSFTSQDSHYSSQVLPPLTVGDLETPLQGTPQMSTNHKHHRGRTKLQVTSPEGEDLIRRLEKLAASIDPTISSNLTDMAVQTSQPDIRVHLREMGTQMSPKHSLEQLAEVEPLLPDENVILYPLTTLKVSRVSSEEGKEASDSL